LEGENEVRKITNTAKATKAPRTRTREVLNMDLREFIEGHYITKTPGNGKKNCTARNMCNPLKS
jgi:hypothetical protein